MKPTALLDESRIVIDLPSSLTKSEVIERLVALAVNQSPAEARPVTDELLRRESIMTTGIGNGVAIPHTHSKLVDSPVAALGVSRAGLEWDAIDAEPVYIVLAFITPEANPSLHAQTLGQTAMLFASEQVRLDTIRAGSAAEILEIFRRNGG